MQESFYFRNHLCITFEIMSLNLYEFIKNNNFQGVSLGLIRRFAVQLLTCLKFLRKQSIVHWWAPRWAAPAAPGRAALTARDPVPPAATSSPRTSC